MGKSGRYASLQNDIQVRSSEEGMVAEWQNSTRSVMTGLRVELMAFYGDRTFKVLDVVMGMERPGLAPGAPTVALGIEEMETVER